MKPAALLFLGFVLLFTAACQGEPVCPPGAITYRPDASQFPAALLAAADPAPVEVEIGGKLTAVYRVITGPVCNDVWSNTVYVACNIEVVAWKDGGNPTPPPTFFENCKLTIEPGTVVYVAAHNDAPYYNGCSCHTGETP